MYCPLCTAEYREGFTESADCHVSLVPSCEEAETGRLRPWKGDRQEKLNGILGALDESGLPSYLQGNCKCRFEYKDFGHSHRPAALHLRI